MAYDKRVWRFLSLMLIAAGSLAIGSARAQADDWMVQQEVTAPGGNITYYVMRSGKGSDESSQIVEGMDENRIKKVLVAPRPADDPAANLTDFSAITLSPDARTLYFETAAWATADAVHAMNLKSGKISLVASGELSCVVLMGQYEGDLVIQQHRYFVAGGSYDPLVLFTPTGKDLGLVALNPISADQCRTLGS